MDPNNRGIYDVDLNPDDERHIVLISKSGTAHIMDIGDQQARLVQIQMGQDNFGYQNSLSSVKYMGNGKEIIASSSLSELILYDT
jgi:hypothetical protein